MTLILTVLAVLAGLTLLLTVCPRRRKQAAYGAAFVLACGAFGLSNGIPTVGGDAMAQPGCTWDGETLTCPRLGGGVDDFCDNPSNGLHGLCNDYSGGGGGGGGYPPSYYYDGYYDGGYGGAFPSTNLIPPKRVITPPPASPSEPLDLCTSLEILSVGFGAGSLSQGVANRVWRTGTSGLPAAFVGVALGVASLFCDDTPDDDTPDDDTP